MQICERTLQSLVWKDPWHIAEYIQYSYWHISTSQGDRSRPMEETPMISHITQKHRFIFFSKATKCHLGAGWERVPPWVPADRGPQCCPYDLSPGGYAFSHVWWLVWLDQRGQCDCRQCALAMRFTCVSDWKGQSAQIKKCITSPTYSGI